MQMRAAINQLASPKVPIDQQKNGGGVHPKRTALTIRLLYSHVIFVAALIIR